MVGRQNGRAEVRRKPLSRSGASDAKKNELKPWLKKHWCIAATANGEFVAQMEEVLDLYCLAYDPQYPVVCMDETNKQLLSDNHHAHIPAKPGKVEREDL